MHNGYFVQYDVTESFLAQVLENRNVSQVLVVDTVTYFDILVVDTVTYFGGNHRARV